MSDAPETDTDIQDIWDQELGQIVLAAIHINVEEVISIQKRNQFMVLFIKQK